MIRATRIAALLVPLVGCDLTSPGIPAPAEVPRPEVQLLVERYSRAGQRSFYTMSTDRRFIAPFTNVPADALQLFPSPSGGIIAYLRETDGLVHLWFMDRHGGDRRAVVSDERVIEDVAWSPNGQRLVIAGSTLEETDDIWSMPSAGGALTNLTPDPKPAIHTDRSPTWSPDGARIAFVSNRSGSMHLWVMDANGENKAPVIPTSSQTSELSAAWSPDGVHIAFVGITSEGRGVGVVQPNGNGFRFFPVAGDVGRVSWSPDGQLLYSTNTTGDYEIYARHLVSGSVINLTQHTDHDFRARSIARTEERPWGGLLPAFSGTMPVGNPAALAIGDVVAGGAPDIVVAVPELEQLRIWQGASAFSFTAIGSLQSPSQISDLAVADVTADGIGDIIALDATAFSVYRGSEAGPGVPSVHDVGGAARGLALRDIEGSGVPHIVVAVDPVQASTRVQLHGDNSTGTGTIIALLDMATDFSGVGRTCVGDFTGGGAPDVVLLSPFASSSIILIPGRGDISFEAPLVFASGAGTSRRTRPICTDFDGDGRTDIALLDPGIRGLVVRHSLGTTLQTPTTIDVVGGAAVPGDLDRDGDSDILVASSDANTLLFLRNLGDGRFATPVILAIELRPALLALGDFNGDGWLDAVAVSADGKLLVLRNAGRP